MYKEVNPQDTIRGQHVSCGIHAGAFIARSPHYFLKTKGQILTTFAVANNGWTSSVNTISVVKTSRLPSSLTGAFLFLHPEHLFLRKHYGKSEKLSSFKNSRKGICTIPS